MVRNIFNLQNIYMGNKIKGIHFFQRLPKDAQEKVIDKCMKESMFDDSEHECSFLNYVIERKYNDLEHFLFSIIEMDSYWEEIINKYS